MQSQLTKGMRRRVMYVENNNGLVDGAQGRIDPVSLPPPPKKRKRRTLPLTCKRRASEIVRRQAALGLGRHAFATSDLGLGSIKALAGAAIAALGAAAVGPSIQLKRAVLNKMKWINRAKTNRKANKPTRTRRGSNRSQTLHISLLLYAKWLRADWTANFPASVSSA